MLINQSSGEQHLILVGIVMLNLLGQMVEEDSLTLQMMAYNPAEHRNYSSKTLPSHEIQISSTAMWISNLA
jgi:hypothetical protein